ADMMRYGAGEANIERQRNLVKGLLAERAKLQQLADIETPGVVFQNGAAPKPGKAKAPNVVDRDKAAKEEAARLKKVLDAQGKGWEDFYEQQEREAREAATYLASLDKERADQIARSAEEATQALIIAEQDRADVANAAHDAWLRAEVEKTRKMQESTDWYYRTVREMADATKQWENAAGDLGMTFSSAFEDMLLKGASVRDMLRGLAQDVLRIAARRAITEPIAAGLTSGLARLGSAWQYRNMPDGGGYDPNAFAIDSFGVGGKAAGGPVSAGELYRVNEHGTEYFRPDVGGRVIPIGEGNGGGMTVNIDARGADASAIARLEATVTRLGGEVRRMPADLMQMARSFPRSPLAGA
ncbi:MAG TPA: hypothetical protein VD838_14980, partial [Anaeromyxobacteraceae bacterium]|nr:hypothetical protein [Anaeromyxobacteraceae bacterium]